ncbi:MAG: hypothetical protein H0U23_14875 [Blastocatellia bacterium]|nr:hypothetical protein [Blastocatellia bacterium]
MKGLLLGLFGAALLLSAFFAGWEIAQRGMLARQPTTRSTAAAKPPPESAHGEVARYELLQLRRTTADGLKEVSEIIRFNRLTGAAERWNAVAVPLSGKMKETNPSIPFIAAEGWEPMNKTLDASMAEIEPLARDGTTPSPQR